MDVTCNRCGTVYEFDDSAVASKGMTVKCTDCGHLFKVQPNSDPVPVPLPPAARMDAAARWQVRRPDGQTQVLESLADLTALIERGELSPNAEISRTGNAWKRLGSIAELAGLFEEAPPSDPPPPQRGLAGRARAPEPRAPARPRRHTPRPHTFESMGQEVGVADQERAAPPSSPPQVAIERDSSPPPLDAAGPAAASSAVATPPPPGTDDVTVPAAAPLPVSSLAEPRRRRGSVWLFIGLPLAIGAALAGVMLHRSSEPAPVAAANPARDLLQRADAALAKHEPASLQSAVADYEKALAFHEDDPHILSSLSRTYAVWAQLLRFRLEYLEATREAKEVEVANLRAEGKRLAQLAKRHAEHAARRNPGNEEAELALGDALRLMGNLVAARAEVDRARSHEGDPSAESLRVAALLEIDEAQGKAEAGRALAERAVGQDSTMIRARLLLARCLLSAGEPGLAKMHVDAVRRVAPGLSALAELDGRAQLGERRPAPAPTPTAAKQQADPAGEEKMLTTEEAMKLVSQGEAALEGGRVGQAKALFERAVEAAPGLKRAHTGLGYVALERSQPRRAVQHFRKAKRRGHPEAFIGLGDAYRRLGRIEDALDAYEAYLVRFPGGDRRSIARRQIELLSEQRTPAAAGSEEP